MTLLRRAVKRIFASAGYRLVPLTDSPSADMEEAFLERHRQYAPFTMTSRERMYALYQAVRYLVAAGIKGDVVECGVWRGGSAMLAARTLLELGEPRPIWLYDTFAGMTEPEPGRDVSIFGWDATAEWRAQRQSTHNSWAYAPIDEVRTNLLATGYPADRLVFVTGKVEETIPAQAPARIALLRLDTDWYSSTYHEMVHLFPRLTPGGVLIVDDYGVWRGCREAVDQALGEQGARILLHRIDLTGRIGIKGG